MVRTKDYFYFIYQEDNSDILHKMPLDLEEVDIEHKDLAWETNVDEHILDTEKSLVMLLYYCRDRYSDADIQHFMETMRRLISPFHR